MLQPEEGSDAHTHPQGVPHLSVRWRGLAVEPVHRAAEKWCSTCGPCARCRFSLGVVECLSFHDPSRSCSFDAEPVFCSFLFALGVAGVM